MSANEASNDKVLVMAMGPGHGVERVMGSMCVAPKDVFHARTVLGVVSTVLREVPMPADR